MQMPARTSPELKPHEPSSSSLSAATPSFPSTQHQHHQDEHQKHALADIKRRKRTTPEALAVLSVAFAENPLPNLQKRKALAEQLNM